MKILFLHGAGDPTANDGSFVLLRRLLIGMGIDESKVIAPILPQPDSPGSAAWTEAISDHITNLDESSLILAHSLGGSCCLNALSSISEKPRINCLVLVASPYWGKDSDWSVEEFVLPEKYNNNLRWIKSIDLVYSEDDEVVPIEHMNHYKRDLAWATTHPLTGPDHIFKKGEVAALCSLLKKRMYDGNGNTNAA